MQSTVVRVLVGAGVALLLLLFWAIGCGGSRVNDNSKNGPKSSASESEVLASVVDAAQPSRLGLTSDADGTANILNQWYEAELSRTEQQPPPVDEELESWLREHIADEALETELLASLNRKLFTATDVEHLRDCILLQSIARTVARGWEKDLDRATALFQFVCRNVGLVPSEDSLAHSRYEVLVLGLGTADDRAWIFSELLRQLRLDCFVLLTDNGEVVWTAVPVDDEVFLFDCRVGAPLGAAEKALTLTEAIADPASVNAFLNDAGIESNFTAEQLEKLTVGTIGEAPLWAPRFAFLDKRLTGESAVRLHEQVVGDEGFVNRLSQVKSFLGRKVSVWPYPLQRMRSVSERNSVDFRAAWDPLLAPATIEINDGQPTVGEGSRRLWRTRIRQFEEELGETLMNYVGVQSDLSDRIKLLGSTDTRRKAQELSLYWMGVCQLELEDWKSATISLEHYLAKYPTREYASQCRILLSQAYLKGERREDAIKVLNEIPKSSPAHADAQHRRSRLK